MKPSAGKSESSAVFKSLVYAGIICAAVLVAIAYVFPAPAEPDKPFTELFFNPSANIPNNSIISKSVSVPFTVSSRENVTRNYRYLTQCGAINDSLEFSLEPGANRSFSFLLVPQSTGWLEDRASLSLSDQTNLYPFNASLAANASAVYQLFPTSVHEPSEITGYLDFGPGSFFQGVGVIDFAAEVPEAAGVAPSNVSVEELRKEPIFISRVRVSIGKTRTVVNRTFRAGFEGDRLVYSLHSDKLEEGFEPPALSEELLGTSPSKLKGTGVSFKIDNQAFTATQRIDSSTEETPWISGGVLYVRQVSEKHFFNLLPRKCSVVLETAQKPLEISFWYRAK